MNPPPPRLVVFMLSVAVVALVLPTLVVAETCYDEERSLRQNQTLQLIRDDYYSHLNLTRMSSRDRTAVFVESSAWESAYSSACMNAGGAYCPRGGSLAIELLSNVTDQTWRLEGSVGLCFAPACCATGTCVVPDNMLTWIEQDVDVALTRWCELDPVLCFRRSSRVDVELSENCVTDSVTQVILLVGIIMGTIILSCACIAFVCRIFKACCQDDRDRADSYVSLDDGRLEEARRRLLADHVREYVGKDAARGDTCAVCLEPFKVREKITEFGETSDACGHIFHAACITQWMQHKDTCPVCRSTWAGGPPANSSP